MSDFSVHIAEQIRDLMSQGTVRSPPTTVYVAVFDDTDTERSTDFQNDRVGLDAGADWAVTNTSFENGVAVDFGEALVDVNGLEDVALFDAATGGEELARFTMNGTPFDISQGTVLTFNTGDLTFDIIDRTEA